MAQTRVQSAEQSTATTTATVTATVAAGPIRPDRIGKQTPKCQTCCQQLGKKACGIKNYSKCVMPPCSSPPPLFSSGTSSHARIAQSASQHFAKNISMITQWTIG